MAKLRLISLRYTVTRPNIKYLFLEHKFGNASTEPGATEAMRGRACLKH